MAYNKRYIFSSTDDVGVKSIYWRNGFLNLGIIDSNNRQGTCISFIDTTGTLMWKKIYFHSTSPVLQGNDIIAYNDYSFYVTGITYLDTINYFDAFYAKFNSNGDSIFFRYYPDSCTNFPFSFYHLSNDTLVILSGRDMYTTPYNHYVIWKVDSVGNSDTAYTSPMTMKYPDQILLKDEYFFVGGTRRTTATGQYNVKVFIDKFDLDFNYITTWNPSTTVNEYFHQLFIFQDELFLAAEISDYNPPIPNTFFRLRIGPLSDYGYWFSKNTIGPFNFSHVWSNIVIVDNSIITVSYRDYQNIFYFLDSLISIISMSPYGYSPNIMQVSDRLCVTPSNRIQGLGCLFPDSIHSSMDHYSFLTDNVLDYLSLIVGKSELKSFSKINVYPNPFGNHISIKNLPSDELCFINIFNVLGENVLTTVTEKDIVINAESLQKGIYVLVIRYANKQYTFKIIKDI